ncbi:serine protease [Streptomyces sp. NPDC047967]|uniref:trypsin-like serine peptidase n=1 Tax=Streptomyces sp. NPDC047967 TaxID=3154924 RepID=UPI0033D5FD41
MTATGTRTDALEAGVLQIRGRRGEAVGLGFLITDELALTCAHVVSAALGTAHGAEPAADARIDVALPLLRAPVPGVPDSAPRITADVEHWIPPQPSGAGDMAVLRLGTVVRDSRPIRLVDEPHVWNHPARVFGFPAGRPGGVWHAALLRARQAHGWIQADLAAGGYRVSGGFSGSPVWDDELRGVVGMMAVAEEGDPPASYLIPTAGLLDSWPGLRPLVSPPSPLRSLASFQEGDAVLGPMSADRLRDIITPLAEAVPGVDDEPRLVDRILAHSGAEPGVPPLLGFALDQLRREAHERLTHEAYANIGGVAEALYDHLVEVWAAHGREADEKAALRLITQLIQVPPESGDVARSVVTRTELGARERHVTQRLAVARLLVTGRDAGVAETVEPAHEAPISSGDKRAGRATEDRSFLARREALRHAMRHWTATARQPDPLPSVDALAGAKLWLGSRGPEVNRAEREFLMLGAAHQRARGRRRRAVRAGCGVLVTLAVLLFGRCPRPRDSRARNARHSPPRLP